MSVDKSGKKHSKTAKHSAAEVKAELIRKGIHLLIALVPFLAAIDLSLTVLLLITGTLFYTWMESMRFLGFSRPVISPVTEMVLRKREQGHFTLGPVTLGLGALLALLIFPPEAAAVAVYALAFGDSASTVIGKFLGRIRPAFLSGKSVEGVLACFTASAAACFLVYHDIRTAIAAALAAMLIDALPLREFDNILLPLAAGLCCVLISPA